MRLITFFLLLLMAPQARASECVVLLHGLFRSENSMNRMAEHLQEAGFEIRNIDYDSTGGTIEELALQALPRAVTACENSSVIHFVTHSMGGILLRQYLLDHDIDHLGRVVMLGPPNQGSEVIDQYGNWPGFSWVSGPAGLQLGTGVGSVPRSLGGVTFDLGVIAGNRSINPILSLFLPEKDDGKVSVASTRVDGMNDHLEMPVNHMFMMRNEAVMRQVVHYLQRGEFERPPFN
jgi:pimeloyl-ACP methyl ester carboxylesterase